MRTSVTGSTLTMPIPVANGSTLRGTHTRATLASPSKESIALEHSLTSRVLFSNQFRCTIPLLHRDITSHARYVGALINIANTLIYEQIRFTYLFSSASSDLSLDLEPYVEKEKWKPIQIWRIFNKNKSYKWENVSISLPVNFHHKYRLKFGTALGLKSFSNFNKKISVAIDNLSLSKECFSIGNACDQYIVATVHMLS